MQRRRAAGEIGLADDFGLASDVDDDEIVRRDRSEADRIGGIRLARPRPARPVIASAAIDDPLLGQNAEDLLQVVAAEPFIGGERQLERRAFDVIDEDVQVVRIDQRVFGRGVEEVRRMADDELIQRGTRGDHHRRRPARAPAGPSGALPCRRNRSGIPRHHAGIERPDINPELERIGGDHGADLSLAEAALDLAAPVRKITAAIAAHPFGRARNPVEIVFQIGGQQFGRETALREDDGLEIPFQELPRHSPRLAQIRPPDPELAIDDRRVDEREQFFAARRTASLDQLKRRFNEPLGQLARICNRRR